MKLNSLSQKRLDFGTLRVGDRRSIQMTIENRNPVSITLRKLQHPMPAVTSLEVVQSSSSATQSKRGGQSLKSAFTANWITVGSHTSTILNAIDLFTKQNFRVPTSYYRPTALRSSTIL
jgi:hypothetical protein